MEQKAMQIGAESNEGLDRLSTNGDALPTRNQVFEYLPAIPRKAIADM